MVCRTGTATREAAADTLRTGGPADLIERSNLNEEKRQWDSQRK